MPKTTSPDWMAVILLLLGSPLAARAQTCPAGSTEVGRQTIGEDLHLWCVPNGTLLDEYRENETRLGEIATGTGQVDRNLAALGKTLEREKAKIEKTGVDLRNIEKDCDAWVDLAGEARKKRNEAAMNALATVLMARVGAIAQEKELASKAELDVLYDEYSQSGLMALATRNAKEAGVVAPLRKWRDTQELLSDLKKMNTLVSSADAVSRGDDWRAIAKLAGLLLKDPKAKILVAETDFAISAVYANAATWTAKERIEQLLNTSQNGLLAIEAFTKVYRDHVDERRKLGHEKRSLQEERTRIETRQTTIRGD